MVGEAFRPPAGGLPVAAILPVRKRNRLPLENYRGGKAYSLTISTCQRNAWFRDKPVAQHYIDALKKASERDSWQVYAYCFMPDHLHLLVGSTNAADLIDFVKRFKQATGWWFRNRYLLAGSLKASPTSSLPPLWHKSFHDHILRSEEDLLHTARYILENPVRAGLVESPADYPYAGSIVRGNELFAS